MFIKNAVQRFCKCYHNLFSGVMKYCFINKSPQYVCCNFSQKYLHGYKYTSAITQRNSFYSEIPSKKYSTSAINDYAWIQNKLHRLSMINNLCSVPRLHLYKDIKYLSSKKTEAGVQDHEESDSEEEIDMYDAFFEEDRDFPENYKNLKIHLTSLRLDAVVSAGLNIARSKVDDYFLESKLSLNGARTLKKSIKMKIGDYVDLLISSEDGHKKVKRVRIVQVDDQRTAKDKLIVYIRAWKSPVDIFVDKKKIY